MIVEKEENKNLQFFEEFVDTTPVRCASDGNTGKCYAFLDDLLCLISVNEGFEGYLSTDRGLDFLLDWRKRNPDKPFYKTKRGSETIYLVEIKISSSSINYLKTKNNEQN